ncbi:unnamed protein product [Bursaphelenchus okinawaensis]|uniref:Protein-tyrosine phosphatase n=1 Tax=Bursaphelenchus okinawaensis TaxID=465554 RepID=A0A811KEF0_9BILA|nr:unnamed protein product [Bursaphelenchus okinawaensis]CAG9102299.1 unnamed protein product [Bursaphelenchus okinawaensis]
MSGGAKIEATGSGRRKRQVQPTAAVLEFVKRLDSITLADLKQEYHEAKTYMPENQKSVAFSENPQKNRYSDVLCYDATRVVLNLEVPPEGDYIHANWVKLPDCENNFIATQAPMEKTASDFWRMVFQENVQTILMFCKCEENGKQKCYPYWPMEEGKYFNYGIMFVNNKKVIKDPKNETVTYLLEVLPDGCSNSNIVKLVQMLDWPDNGVPKNAASVVKLLHSIKRVKDPCVVHCAAGIGRTGTVLMAAFAIARMLKNKEVNMRKLMGQIRDRRALSVQTENQYIFAHVIICAYFTFKFRSPQFQCLRFYDEFLTSIYASLEH